MSLIPPEISKANLTKIEDSWRSCLAPPPKQTVVEWCEENIILTPGISALPGPFRIANSPWLATPLNLMQDRNVHQITLMFGAQLSKTLLLSLTSLWTCCEDSGNGLFVWASQDDAKSFVKDRFDPLIENCPEVRKRLPNRRETDTNLEKFFDSCTLKFVGATTNQVASRTCKYIWATEIDKYQESEDSKESSVTQNVIERTSTYRNFGRKIIFECTPTIVNSPIHQHFMNGSQEYFYVPCPGCGLFQPLVFEQLVFREFKINGVWDKEKVLTETKYKCSGCERLIEDKEKYKMLQNGYWVARQPRGRNRSFTINQLYPSWVNFGDTALNAIETKNTDGSINFQNFKKHMNSVRGLPWELQSDTAGESDILKHKLTYNELEVPEAVQALFLTADKQKDSCYYTIWGWTNTDTAYLVQYGNVPDMAGLLQVVGQIRVKSPAGELAIQRCFIDSGYETDEVIKFCQANTNWHPVKGDGGITQHEEPTRWGKSGLMLINTVYFKNAIQSKLKITPGNPGSWNLHNRTGPEFAYQISSEKAVITKDSNGAPKLKWKKMHYMNHYLDCTVYAFAVSHAFNIRQLSETVPLGNRKPVTDVKSDDGEPVKSTFKRPDGRDFWDISY